ncbi:unnamed protein product [Phytomonas sp. Hart1]|nr:unnamed protein product [Phytomonas sp. Hart1]|eukprot:CCW71009.1 unnamed protein product [Phytomonas sp. isolate Hart1]
MTYIFVTLPLMEAKKVTQNCQIGVDISSSKINMLEKKRNECLQIFNNMNKKTEDSLIFESTFTLKMVEYADSYVANLVNIVKLFPSFAVKKYYTWSSPLGENQCIPYDDYRYELIAIYYNIAAHFVNVAHHFLCVKSKVGNISSLEKNSYHVLLKAAGYFSLVKNVVDNIKFQPIGVAEMPFKPDDVIALFSFLETLSLAQAQEIGTTRSNNVGPKQTSDLTTKLCHQLFLFYKECNEISNSVKSCSKNFSNMSALCQLKSDVFLSLMYNYAASWAFTSSPSNALHFMNRANIEVAKIQKHAKVNKKLRSIYSCEKILENCYSTIKRNDERLRKINSLVHRVKMTEGEIQPPIPQVLAVKEKIELPIELPTPASIQ